MNILRITMQDEEGCPFGQPPADVLLQRLKNKKEDPLQYVIQENRNDTNENKSLKRFHDYSPFVKKTKTRNGDPDYSARIALFVSALLLLSSSEYSFIFPQFIFGSKERFSTKRTPANAGVQKRED